jgi:hypothetical protein
VNALQMLEGLVTGRVPVGALFHLIVEHLLNVVIRGQS